MIKLITLDNHKCLKVSNDVLAICKPLFLYTPINFFNFLRVFSIGARLTLCTRPDWIEYYFAKHLYNNSVFLFNKECLQTRYFFHSSHVNNSVIQLAKDNFNICYGFALIKRHKDYVDFYHFATTRDNFSIYNFYMNNLDILERFALYFEEKAMHLIKSVKPYTPEFQTYQQPHDWAPTEYQSKEFLAATKFKKIIISEKKNLYLSYREAECMCFLLNGFTAKEIAQKINLSPRTVEYYLQNIRKRFRVHTHAGLINALTEYRILLEKAMGYYIH